jgi:hypothetical protein
MSRDDFHAARVAGLRDHHAEDLAESAAFLARWKSGLREEAFRRAGIPPVSSATFEHMPFPGFRNMAEV